MVIDTGSIIHTCNRMLCTQSHLVFDLGLPLQIRRLTLTRVSRPLTPITATLYPLLSPSIRTPLWDDLSSCQPRAIVTHYSSAKIGAMSLLVIRGYGLQSYSIEILLIASTFIAAQLKSVECAHTSALVSIKMLRYLYASLSVCLSKTEAECCTVQLLIHFSTPKNLAIFNDADPPSWYVNFRDVFVVSALRPTSLERLERLFQRFRTRSITHIHFPQYSRLKEAHPINHLGLLPITSWIATRLMSNS